MARDQNPNLRILELAVERLGPLADEMVFLGGCATGLLLTDVAAPPIRSRVASTRATTSMILPSPTFQKTRASQWAGRTKRKS
jgi:hypothetical protein